MTLDESLVSKCQDYSDFEALGLCHSDVTESYLYSSIFTSKCNITSKSQEDLGSPPTSQSFNLLSDIEDLFVIQKNRQIEKTDQATDVALVEKRPIKPQKKTFDPN